jgi:hypothetical protein
LRVEEAVRVEKLMSLTVGEFRHTIVPLVGEPLVAGCTEVKIAVGSGTVVVGYDPRPSVRLGGLIDMPRAIVSLTFAGVSAAERSAFLTRFDLTFRRGGG